MLVRSPSISFVSGRELFQIRNIERYTNTRIQRSRVPTEAEVSDAKENAFIGKLRTPAQHGAPRGAVCSARKTSGLTDD